MIKFSLLSRVQKLIYTGIALVVLVAAGFLALWWHDSGVVKRYEAGVQEERRVEVAQDEKNITKEFTAVNNSRDGAVKRMLDAVKANRLEGAGGDTSRADGTGGVTPLDVSYSLRYPEIDRQEIDKRELYRQVEHLTQGMACDVLALYLWEDYFPDAYFECEYDAAGREIRFIEMDFAP